MPSIRPSLPPYQDDNNVWHCGARLRGARTGKQCANVAPLEPHRCWLHGGRSRGVAEGQQQRASLAAAQELVATYGLPRTIDPVAAVLEEIARTAGHIDWLSGVIQELDPEALAWGLTKTEDVGASEYTGTNTTEASGISVWLELYHRERAHLVKVCAAAMAHGIAERQVRLAEQQGALIADVLRATLADPSLGLTETQRKAAPDVIRRHLAVVRGA